MTTTPTGSVPARIPRPALAAQIAAALETSAVLLIAGAGYGKTTAVEEALADRTGPIAWLALTPRERDPGRLLLALLEELNRALPGVADGLREELERGPRVTVRDAERRLLDELDVLLVEPVVVVLDDGEQLVGAPEALTVVEALLRSRPGRLRLVVASRRPLGLSLAKARANGRVVELTEADLAFSADECARLLRARSGAEPTAEAVAERMGATLGWPLGIALGAERGASSEQALLAYVEEELLDARSAAERRQLLDASVVEELTPELLEPLGLPRDFISSGAAELLLLRPLPGRSGAAAFHPLLRAFLRDRWRAERTPEQQTALLARVAGPLAAAGHPAEAIAAALDAECWDEALRIVAHDAQALLKVAPETVRAWLRRLPAPARSAPLARLFEARLALAEGQPAEAARLLAGAIPALDAESVQAGWAGRLALAEGLYWSGRMDAFGELAADVDAALDERPGPQVEATGWLTANALAAAGATTAAERLIARMLDAGAESTAAYRGWTGLYLLAGRGEMGAVLEAIEPQLAGATHDDYLRRRDLLLPLAIFLLSMQGRHDEGARLGTRYAEVSEALGCRPDMQRLSDLTHGWQLALAGRLDEAETALSPIAGPQPATWASICHPVAMAVLAHGRGRHADAATWAERGLALAAQAPAVMAADSLPALAQALAPTDPNRAELVLTATLERLDATLPGPAGSFARARLIAARACLRHAAGAPAELCAHDLCDALWEAGQAHVEFVRVEWPRLRRPLWELLDAGALNPALALSSLEQALPDELLPFADHPSAAVRVTVAEALGRSGHGEADDRLAQLLGDGDPDVASAAAAARLHATAEPPARSFRLLGGFALTRGGWPVPERAWERPLAQRLVRFLLLQDEAPVPEEALLEAFWPGRAARSARAVLQVNLSRARAVLDPPNAPRSAILSSERTYRLVLADRDDVDARTYLRATEAALATRGRSRRETLATAARLWTGEPLPEERYADWAQPWRERLLRTHRELLVALLDAHAAVGDYSAALEAGHAALAIEPLDERVHRELMRAYARSGRRGRALRQYLACRRVLVDELGIEPDEQTAALHRRLLAGETV